LEGAVIAYGRTVKPGRRQVLLRNLLIDIDPSGQAPNPPGRQAPNRAQRRRKKRWLAMAAARFGERRRLAETPARCLLRVLSGPPTCRPFAVAVVRALGAYVTTTTL
jgi:hypothetical protein